jgi:hypothetical protein
MKINFTNREYRALIDMIYLADWTLHAHKVGEPKDEYSALEQKIFSHAGDFGCDDLIVFDKELKGYFPTRDFEESEAVQAAIDEYNDDTFWDELVDRLAQRDVSVRYSEEQIRSMSVEERVHLFSEAEQPYDDEFSARGIDRLKIDKGNG